MCLIFEFGIGHQSSSSVKARKVTCNMRGSRKFCQRVSNIECWLGSFVIFQGIRTSIAKKPYIFVIFRGFGPPVFPLDPPMCKFYKNNVL